MDIVEVTSPVTPPPPLCMIHNIAQNSVEHKKSPAKQKSGWVGVVLKGRRDDNDNTRCADEKWPIASAHSFAEVLHFGFKCY